jgi:Brf1-like TBP-binding domain
LSVGDFQNIWLEADQNPPAFNITKKRRVEETGAVETGTAEVVDGAEMAEKEFTEIDEMLEQEVEGLISTQPTPIHQSTNEDDGNLSDLDNDPEIAAILNVSKTAAAFKDSIWTSANADWIAQQEEKALRGEIVRVSRPKKQKKESFAGANAGDSVRNMIDAKPMLSKKINYDAIDSLVLVADLV